MPNQDLSGDGFRDISAVDARLAELEQEKQQFDLTYHGLFKTNLRQLCDYRNITAYIKRIYGLPGIADTVSPEHIMAGYYSIRALNPSGIVPVGPINLW